MMTTNGVARKASVNRVTIEQLELACRHVQELRAVGVTENQAIRLLEHFTDLYAHLHKGGSASPYRASRIPYPQWSVAAKKLKRKNPDIKAAGNLVVEHGTPRRPFARKVIELYQNKNLNENEMAKLVKRYWQLAVVTKQEDQVLNSRFRTVFFSSPKKRWDAGGIKFDKSTVREKISN